MITLLIFASGWIPSILLFEKHPLIALGLQIAMYRAMWWNDARANPRRPIAPQDTHLEAAQREVEDLLGGGTL